LMNDQAADVLPRTVKAVIASATKAFVPPMLFPVFLLMILFMAVSFLIPDAVCNVRRHLG